MREDGDIPGSAGPQNVASSRLRAGLRLSWNDCIRLLYCTKAARLIPSVNLLLFGHWQLIVREQGETMEASNFDEGTDEERCSLVKVCIIATLLPHLQSHTFSRSTTG